MKALDIQKTLSKSSHFKPDITKLIDSSTDHPVNNSSAWIIFPITKFKKLQLNEKWVLKVMEKPVQLIKKVLIKEI